MQHVEARRLRQGGVGGDPEAAQVAPLLPREAEAWTGLPTDPAAAGLLRRLVAGRAADARTMEGRGPTLRAAPVLDLVERNERLRAMAA